MDPITALHVWVLYETEDVASTSHTLSRTPQLPGRCSTAILVSAIALLLTGRSLQARTFPEAGRAYIASSPGFTVNIRNGPGTEYSVVNTLARGTPLDTNGQYVNGWAQLNDGNWVAGYLINSNNPVEVAPPVAAAAYIDTPAGYNLNIRQGPGTQYAAINTLSRGTPITVSGLYQNGWAQLIDGSWAAGNWVQVGQPITPATPSPAPTSQPTFLQLGSQGAAVTDLQGRLQVLQYLPAEFAPDGIFAESTQIAVRDFQQVNSLAIDGVAGPQTLALLYSDAALVKPPNTEVAVSQPSASPTEQPAPTPTPEPTPTPSPTPSPSPAPPEQAEQATPRDVRVATGDGMDMLVFTGPGTQHDQLSPIADGTQVRITGQFEGNWAELEGGGWAYLPWLEF